LPPLVARRSLKPQLNQIRSWVRQGRTDAWIAHQLEVTVPDLTAFKREHDLAPPEEGEGEPGPAEELEVDLRAEDDALVAAALDAEPEETAPSADDAEGSAEPGAAGVATDTGAEGGLDAERPRRRRGRRGGRGRRSRGRRQPGEPFEGTFDHGEEGYGLWLDPAVQDDPIYAEHWAGHRPVTVVIEAEQIVLRRAGEGAEGGEGANGGEGPDADSASPAATGDSSPSAEVEEEDDG
jgi:hypothetical protein